MIAKAPFGSTGHESTRTLFGAAALGSVTQAEADRTLELLLEHGINHIDTAASYGDAELRLAPWLTQHRDDFFLATKTGQRDRAGAREEIRRSLDRLGVDRVDLLQLHNLVDVIEWETALREGGALEAAVEARDEGLVRFIGVTGHGLTVAKMHRRSLDRFPFDSVLLPYSYVQMRDERYAADFEALAAVCAERNVAVQTIKSITLAPWDGRDADGRHLVRAVARAGRHRSRRALGARPAGRLPEHRRRRRAAAEGARRGEPLRVETVRRDDGRARCTAQPRPTLLVAGDPTPIAGRARCFVLRLARRRQPRSGSQPGR